MTAGVKNLADNKPIDAGLNRFIEGARRASQLRAKNLQILIQTRDKLREWQVAETAFLNFGNVKRPAMTEAELRDIAGKLTEKEEALRNQLQEARKATLFGSDEERLATAYARLVGELEGYERRARLLRDEIEKLIEATDPGKLKRAAGAAIGVDVEYRLFPEVRDKLNVLLPELQKLLVTLLKPEEVEELPGLDERHLVENPSRYRARWALSEPCLGEFLMKIGKVEIVGQQWKPMFDARVRLDTLEKAVAAYQGNMADKVKAACGFFINARRQGLGAFYAAWYNEDAKRLLDPKLHFPLVSPVDDIDSAFLTKPALLAAVSLLKTISVDLDPASAGMKAIDEVSKRPLNELREKLKTIEPLRAAVLAENGVVRQMKVVLRGTGAQTAPGGPGADFAGKYFQQMQLRNGKAGNCADVGSRVQTDSPGDVPLATFSLDQVFHFHFYRDGKLKDVPTPEGWTPLRLLHERSATSSPDGRSWAVGITPLTKEEAGRGKDPAVDRWILFEFRFDDPVPPRDDWPTRRKLGFQSR